MAKRWPLVVFALLLLAGGAVRWHIARGWSYAGSDSYGYLRTAEELRLQGRYALGPPPEPLYYGRPPGYPLLLAALTRSEAPGWWERDSDNWGRILHGQTALELLTLPWIVFALLRRRVGPAWALVGVAGALFWPLTVVLSSVILTELLATLLTTATLALLLVSDGRPWRFAAAGALAGLTFLVRPDSVLLAAPFAVALCFVAGWRPRLRSGLCALGAVLVVVGPWALRNVAQFGAPHLFVVGLDRTSRPHGGGAFRDWMSTWAVNATELSTYEYCFNRDTGCVLTDSVYPPQAFASPRQQERVGDLLRLHALRTDEERVERGFAALAAERRRHRPLTTRLVLPLRRAVLLWTRPDTIVDKHDRRPWPAVYTRLAPWLPALCVAFALAFAASLVGLLAQRSSRAWAAILGSAVLVRTAFLAYYYFPEPRYLYETVPAAGLVIVLALAALSARLLRWRQRA